MKPVTTAAPLQKQVISDLPAVTTRRYAVPYAYVVLVVLICLLGETALLYGRSIHLSFVSDDWPILQGSRDVQAIFAVGGGYHYNPIPRLVVFALYSAFGLQVVPYHIAGILLFFVGSALVVCLALCLTGRMGIAVLAGVIFVAYGSQYEAAIWGVVGYWHTTSTILYLAGLILYIVSHNPKLTSGWRRLTYSGFLIALILGPFAHEQTTSLIAACALYRLLVLEHDAGFQRSALARRAQAWTQDFAAPVALILVYLAFKAWMGSQTTTPQAPGLQASWDVLSFTACLGFFQAFIPGLGLHDLLRLSLDQRGPHYHVRVLIAQVLALSVIALFARPTCRFLLAWTVLLVLAMTVGLGNISSRHLYLITVPASILWASAAFEVKNRMPSILARFRLSMRYASVSGWVLACALVLALVLAGTKYALTQQQAWATASAHRDRLLADVSAFARSNPRAANLYLVDLPDYVSSPTGESVYMFRNSPQAWVQLSLPGRFRLVQAIRTQDTFPIARGYTILASVADLRRLKADPAALVLQYDPRSGSLVLWRVPPRAPADVPRGTVPAQIPMGELTSGLQFDQSFVSQCSRLAEVDVELATYARVNTHPVTIRVLDGTGHHVIDERTVPGPKIQDNAWFSFVFPPIVNSRNGHYIISLISPEGRSGNAITVWRSASDSYRRGQATINGKPVGGDLVFSYACASKK